VDGLLLFGRTLSSHPAQTISKLIDVALSKLVDAV
jgi:hypothetical protein